MHQSPRSTWTHRIQKHADTPQSDLRLGPFLFQKIPPLIARRIVLVKKARRDSVTCDALADVLGVSRARVQQLEAGD